MEGSPSNEEEEVPKKNATFYEYHPCYFLEETLKAVFKCLGLEIGTNTNEQKCSVVKSSSDSEEDPITLENNATMDQKSYQEVLISSEQSPDQQGCSTSQSFEITSLIIRPFSRRSDLSKGSDPQTN